MTKINGDSQVSVATTEKRGVVKPDDTTIGIQGDGTLHLKEPLPQSITPVSGEFLTGYSAATGLFTQATGAGVSHTHSESLTDGNANFIFAATLTTGGDCIVVCGVPD